MVKKFLFLFILILVTANISYASPSIYINIPTYQLSIIDNEKILKTYPVAVGTVYEQTPVGEFIIFFKEKNPTWYPSANFEDRTPVPQGPDNPLGTRWLEFKESFGIHGTNKGWDIENPVSGGCIRMYDLDAQELYEQIALNTPVSISYDTIILEETPKHLKVSIYYDIYKNGTNTEENYFNKLLKYQNIYIIPVTAPKFPSYSESPLTILLPRKEPLVQTSNESKTLTKK